MEGFVPTRASQIKENATNDYISIDYQTSKRTKSRNDLDNKKSLKNDLINSKMKQNDPIDLKQQQEKEMKKARYDVIKFGMSGFEKVKARKAKVELAISLGARPPKNRRTNYKALKVRRKMQKDKEEEHVTGFTSSMLKPKSKKIRKTDSSGILGVYGKVAKNSMVKQKS